MTSPPYFGLRDYGVDGQIGLEESLDEYIAELVDVCDAIRHVLRPDGSLWLNLGDSYDDGKNKMLVPHRVAIALQDDGWILRNDVTWHKPNPMPQSVKDRLNTTTEQIFHLVPNREYWYDLDAIREPHAESTKARAENSGGSGIVADVPGESAHKGFREKDYADQLHEAGKNPGDVFEVTTKPFPDAHFAVYPPELCEKPIKATAPPKVCVECGAPYERGVEVGEKPELPDEGMIYDPTRGQNVSVEALRKMKEKNPGGQASNTNPLPKPKEFKGWQQACACDADVTLSGIALDPFAGAGTTLLKAKELGRRFMGIELNPEYADMARERCGLSLEDPSNARDDEEAGLESFASE